MTYKATRNEQGHLVIKGVPIFCECKRGEHNYNRKWLEEAASTAKQATKEGYSAPLHIRHHGDEGVRPAGFFKITGVRDITFKGKRRAALFADLTITDPGADYEVVSSRLPWRSVEIFRPTVPNIDSLALLDHDAPFLELPMLMVKVDEPEQDEALFSPEGAVAFATFRHDHTAERAPDDEAMVACFKRGGASTVLFHMDPNDITMDDETKPDDEQNANNTPEGEHFADDKPKFGEGGDDKPESMGGDESSSDTDGDGDVDEDDSSDLAMVCDLIKSGKISVADMEEIKRAIVEQQQTMGAPPEQQPGQQAPAPIPGAQQMSKNDDNVTPAQFKKLTDENAELRGTVVAMQKRLDERDATDAKKVAVDGAMQRFADRPMGADFRTELETNYDAMGGEGFQKFVDTLANKLGAFRADEPGSDDTDLPVDTPEEVLAFTAQGAKATERAAHFSREHDELSRRGLCSMDKQTYVGHNMRGEGFKDPEPAAAK